MLDIIDRDTSLNTLRHDDPYSNGNATGTGSSENPIMVRSLEMN